MTDLHHDEVLLLGAGFSCAVSPCMPVADQLGERAYELALQRWPDLELASAPSFSPEYPFETWLSLLAQDLPYFSEAENRQNAATFAKLRDAIADALQDAQDEALRCEPPDCFYTLLGTLHHLRAGVVTFNYDTLIESGVESTWLHRAGPVPLEALDSTNPMLPGPKADAMRIRSGDILRGLPPFPVTAGFVWGGDPPDTFQLLKLHGSLDWWQVPADTSGATLNRSHVLPAFGDPARLSEEDRRRFLPGRERLIIPPLAVKSSYYSNPMTRQLWQDAHDALRHAERIALVGYSLPITDRVTAGMLSHAMADRDDLIVEVVNPRAEDVAKRVAALGGPKQGSGRLVFIDGDDCLAEYTRQITSRAQEKLVAQLRALQPPSSHPGTVVVSWAVGIQAHTVVVGQIIDVGNAALELVPDESGLVNTTAANGQPTVEEFLRLIQDMRRITVRAGPDHRLPIVGYEALISRIGASSTPSS